MRIVQIVPFLAPGRGVGGVAMSLDREFRALGHDVEAFTYTTARGGSWRPPRGRVAERIAQIQRSVWFSTVGTARARRFLADRPDAVSLCHNNVLAGDVFLEHGIVSAAMKAHGDPAWRRWANPHQWFVEARERLRMRGDAHRVIVVPTAAEADSVRHVYRRVKPPLEVIPHGVDLERFRPPTASERADARAALSLGDDDRVALFIGHEFERKGLLVAIDALREATTVLLLVVGGAARSVQRARRHAQEAGVGDRVLFVGPRDDLLPYLWASDMFVFPSAYESSGLVIAEALASGLPVIVTRVGVAPELVRDGETGYLIARDPHECADRLERLAADEPGSWTPRARAAVEHLSWREVAQRYVALFERLAAERAGVDA